MSLLIEMLFILVAGALIMARLGCFKKGAFDRRAVKQRRLDEEIASLRKLLAFYRKEPIKAWRAYHACRMEGPIDQLADCQAKVLSDAIAYNERELNKAIKRRLHLQQA